MEQKTSNRRKCPNCGATISDYTLTCPECGYALDSGSKASQRVEDQIDALCQQLYDTENMIVGNVVNRQVDIINSFSVPVTKEALLLGFTFAKAQFRCAVITENGLGHAWKAKMRQFYDLLKAQPGLDDSMIKYVESNADILDEDVPQHNASKKKAIVLWIIAWIIFVIGLVNAKGV